MAAAANWRAILEALKLLGTSENVTKLQSHQKQRDTVVLMLTSANSRYRTTNADWVVEKALSVLLDAIVASRQVGDIELEKLMMEFLRVTVFPPDMYRSYKGKEDCRDEQPDQKKAKVELRIPKLWEQESVFGSRPEHGQILCESLMTYGRPLMTDPYLKILVACGFERVIIPEPSGLRTAHCRLLGKFVEIVDTFRLHVKGNRHSYMGTFIKNSLHALIVNDDIDLIELEDLVNQVADVDTMILQPLNPILWRRWRSGDLISVMTRVCAYYNKTQSSKRLFGMIFNLTFEEDSDNLHMLFAQPFKALTSQWLPSALIADLEYLTRTAFNVFKTPTENQNKLYKIINIFLTAICYELDCLDINGLSMSERDEKDLTGILDKIRHILEKYIGVGIYWIDLASKYWKIEKTRRMYLTDGGYDTKFLSDECCEKLKTLDDHLIPKSGAQPMADLLILRLEWSVIHEQNVKKHTKRLEQFLQSNKVQLTEYSQEILLRLVPEVYDFCPKAATTLVLRLMAMNCTVLTDEIFAMSSAILDSVTRVTTTEAMLDLIPITFLSIDQKVEIFKDRIIIDKDTINNIYRLLTPSNSPGEVKPAKAFELGQKFFTSICNTIEKDSDPMWYDLANMSAKEVYSSGSSDTDILKAIDEHFNDEIVLHSLINLLRRKEEIDIGELINRMFECNPMERFTTFRDLVGLLSLKSQNRDLTQGQLSKLKLLTTITTTKIGFAGDRRELESLSKLLKKILDILERQGESNALDLLRQEKHPVVIGSLWKLLKRNQITIRMKMMPKDRRILELPHVVSAVNNQQVSEFGYKSANKDDPKEQAMQRWAHKTIDELIIMAAETGDYPFTSNICRQLFDLKLNMSRVRLQRILELVIDIPEEPSEIDFKIFISILDVMIGTEKLRNKITLLAPAVIASIRVYLGAILKYKDPPRELIEMLRRLLQSISSNTDLAAKIGRPAGFILEPFLSLAMKFPEVNNTSECLKLLYKMGSETQLKSHFGALPVVFRKKAAESYRLWLDECGNMKKNSFMSV